MQRREGGVRAACTDVRAAGGGVVKVWECVRRLESRGGLESQGTVSSGVRAA